MREVVKTAGTIVFNEKNEVLLLNHVKKEGGRYGFPAGKFEKNENSLECAVRELEEETDLVACMREMVELPTTYEKPMKVNGKTKTYTMSVYYCPKWSGYAKVSSEGSPEWFTVSQINQLPESACRPNLKRMLRECLTYRREITSTV